MTENTTATTPSRALADAYLDCWQRHDPDDIIAHHTEDSVLASPFSEILVTGREAIREALAGVFAVWPDMHYEVHRLAVTDSVIVAESTVRVTQAVPLTLRGVLVEPTGQTIRYTVADVLHLEDGLITRKDVYLDVMGYLHAMRRADHPAAAAAAS